MDTAACVTPSTRPLANSSRTTFRTTERLPAPARDLLPSNGLWPPAPRRQRPGPAGASTRRTRAGAALSNRRSLMSPLTTPGARPLGARDPAEQIRHDMGRRVAGYAAAGPAAIDRRLAELDREW